MARILVTGGAGFVGSSVAEALLKEGDDVVALDDLSTGDRANVPARVDLIVADIVDAGALERALERRRFDAIVHCASRTKVLESVEKPDLYQRVIVDGTRNMLVVGSRCGARDFVNFSSGGVIYGETPTCAGEDVPPAPISPYGTCKAAAAREASRHERWSSPGRSGTCSTAGSDPNTVVIAVTSALMLVATPVPTL